MPIIWNDATMSTGVADIDAQHKELISRLNVLVDAMTQGKGRQEIENILGFLGEYAVKHFAHEEDCMERNRCPMAAANKKAHEYFIRTFTALSDRIKQEGPSVSLVIQVQQQLSDWVVNHIMKVDKHMNTCVKSGARA